MADDHAAVAQGISMGWRIIDRIVDAPQHPIGNALISQGFRADRRGLALAINAAGSNLRTLTVPLLGGFLIAALGWRSTLMLFGLPGVLSGRQMDHGPGPIVGVRSPSSRQRPHIRAPGMGAAQLT
jgi:MFS family permease